MRVRESEGHDGKVRIEMLASRGEPGLESGTGARKDVIARSG